MEVYEKVLSLLKEYFEVSYKGRDGYKNLFLNGGCYWLASYLNGLIPGSYLLINRVEEHCALCVGGKAYDITGMISSKGYHKASDREISFMKKNYKPRFEVVCLEKYLAEKL